MASNIRRVDIKAETAGEPAETGSRLAEEKPTEAGSGLDENVTGVLSYLFGFVSGLIFFCPG